MFNTRNVSCRRWTSIPLELATVPDSEDFIMEYEAAPYKGREWGVFHRSTRNWMVFGTERSIRKRVDELNGKTEATVRNGDYGK